MPTTLSKTTSTNFHHSFWVFQALYGLSSISEHYDRHMADAFTGFQSFRRIVDDIVIYDHNASEHIVHVCQFLQRCANMNIALNANSYNPQSLLLAYNYHLKGIRLTRRSLRPSLNAPHQQAVMTCSLL